MAAFTVIAVKIKLTPFLDTVHVHISRHNMPPPPTSGDLTSKWSHGSLVSWASFLPIFSFLYATLQFSTSGHVRDRRTDRQTDGQTTMALWGHNK